MSPRFVLGRENVPCVAEVVNRSLKADCTDFIYLFKFKSFDQFNPPELPHVLDIYSVVVLYITHFYIIREEGGSGRLSSPPFI